MDLREGLSEDDLYNTRHWSQCPMTKKILEKSKILSVNLRLELIKQLILSKDKSWSRILQISEEILIIDDKNIMALVRKLRFVYNYRKINQPRAIFIGTSKLLMRIGFFFSKNF